MSLFFPVYKDERTVRTVTQKARLLLASLGGAYEIVIVDDGSPDRSGAIADELAREHPEVRVIHHARNLGYGAAVRSGIAASRYEIVCMTDGDDEYEVEDFRKLLKLKHHYDLIITFRYRKIYSSTRIFVSWVYNVVLRFFFRTPFRDVSTGLRLVRRSVLAGHRARVDQPVHRRGAGDQGDAQGLPRRRGRHPDVPAQLRLGQLDLDPEHPGHDPRHVAHLPPTSSRTPTTCRAAARDAETRRQRYSM